VNFGLFPELGQRFRGRDKHRLKRKALSDRALAALAGWLAPESVAAE
jgi:folate-dependent tRNA-U54 methylase TrmFO/GidA